MTLGSVLLSLWIKIIPSIGLLGGEPSYLKAFPKDPKLTVEWGTFDTTLRNNQTIAIWVREWNNADSGVVFLPFPLETFELWVKTTDSMFRVGILLDGNSAFPAKASVFSILKFDAIGVLQHIRNIENAQLILRTPSPFVIPDSARKVKLLPPDNLYLDTWFRVADSLQKTTPLGKMVPSPTGFSNNGGNVFENRFHQCALLRPWLDSLERNNLAFGTAHANALILLNNTFCQRKIVYDDISIPNWPTLRGIYRCRAEISRKTPNANKICRDTKWAFDTLSASLAHLTAKLPADGYHRYKFLSGKDTVYLNLTSWYDSIPGEYFP